MHRRAFLTGLTSLVAAPAIVPYANLMPVRRVIAPQSGIYLVTAFAGGVTWFDPDYDVSGPVTIAGIELGLGDRILVRG